MCIWCSGKCFDSYSNTMVRIWVINHPASYSGYLHFTGGDTPAVSCQNSSSQTSTPRTTRPLEYPRGKLTQISKITIYNG